MQVGENGAQPGEVRAVKPVPVDRAAGTTRTLIADAHAPTASKSASRSCTGTCFESFSVASGRTREPRRAS